MVFPKVLDFPFLINKFAFFIFKWFFGNNPVIVEPFAFLLEVGKKFLLFFKGGIKGSELFAKVESVLLGLDVLYFLGLVDTLLFDFYC
jgi:hypothetical protein